MEDTDKQTFLKIAQENEKDKPQTGMKYLQKACIDKILLSEIHKELFKLSTTKLTTKKGLKTR